MSPALEVRPSWMGAMGRVDKFLMGFLGEEGPTEAGVG